MGASHRPYLWSQQLLWWVWVTASGMGPLTGGIVDWGSGSGMGLGADSMSLRVGGSMVRDLVAV